MADVMPDYMVEQQKLRADIATLESTIQKQLLSIMQADAQRMKYVENIEASKEAIKERKKQLAGLEKEHGKALPPNLAE